MEASYIDQEVFHYPGIGEVISNESPNTFFDYAVDRDQITIVGSKQELIDQVARLRKGEINELFTTNIIISAFTKDYVEALEPKGVVLTAFNDRYPLGCYALDYFDTPGEPIQTSQPTIFRLSNQFNGKFALITKPMDAFSFDTLTENAFENLNTTTQAVAICTKNKDGQHVWGKTYLYPDGLHVQAPLTSTDQYAQSCFEGMIAMVSATGEIIVLRPYDNAARLRKSAAYLGIPPLAEQQFVDSVKYTILANKAYLPRPGSDEKLYIRPYLKGLEGGYGVGPAYSYAFVVEVFPYGRFVGRKGDLLSLVTIDGKRRSHQGGMGAVKASGNYAQTIVDRQLAKGGELPGFAGQRFHDVLYWGEARRSIQLDGATVTTVHDVIDEDAAGNIFFMRETADEVVLYTPSLARESILGGYVRDTVIQLAKLINLSVLEMDLSLADVETMTGAFLTGSAIGIVRIDSITYKDKVVRFDQLVTQTFTQNPTVFTFHRLYELLYGLRKGLPQQAIDWARLPAWSYEIGHA